MLAAACPPDANKSKKARHPHRTTHNISCGMHRECTSHASHFCVVPLPMLCGEELPSLVQGVYYCSYGANIGRRQATVSGTGYYK